MVEWKRLGDIGEVCMCKRIMKDQTSDSGEIPFFKIGTFGSTADSYISRELFDDYKKKYSYPKKGEILISASGTIGRSVIFDGKDAYFQDSNIVWISNDESAVLNKYLYYCYQIIDWKVDGGTIKRLYNYNLKNATIPVPSLPEQNRIVGILDTFTLSIENLKEQIAQRRKQYEYYRDQLLDLEGKEGVEMKTIKEVFDTRNGYTPSTSNSSFWDGGTLPWFKMEDIRDNGRILNDSNLHITPKALKGKGLFKANSILLATSATIGEHALITVEHLSNQRFTNFYPNRMFENKINMKYVYYFMFEVDKWCKQHINQGGFASVDMSSLYSLQIPVPTLAKQSRIISILDTFEASISNLEAQLKEREKQYEYYRNKLLTFE